MIWPRGGKNKVWHDRVWKVRVWKSRVCEMVWPGGRGDSWVVTPDVSTPSTPSQSRTNPTIIIPSNKSDPKYHHRHHRQHLVTSWHLQGRGGEVMYNIIIIKIIIIIMKMMIPGGWWPSREQFRGHLAFLAPNYTMDALPLLSLLLPTRPLNQTTVKHHHHFHLCHHHHHPFINHKTF